MNRKTAIKLLASTACALMGQRVIKAQETPNGVPHEQTISGQGYITQSSAMLAQLNVKSGLSLDMEYFSGFVIRNGTETITITPEEIWAALKDGK